MPTWRTLLAKDARMLRNRGLIELAVVAGIGCVLVLGAPHSRQATLIGAGILSVIAGAHVLLPSAYVVSGIRGERLRAAALWLQTPAAGWRLLTSKLLVAFAYALASWLIVLAFSYSEIPRALGFIMLHTSTCGPSAVGTGPNAASFSGAVTPCTTSATPLDMAVVRTWLPRYALAISVAVLLCGLYIAAWVAIGLMAVLSVHRRFVRLAVGVLSFAVPAWGIPALRNLPGYSGLWSVTLQTPAGGTRLPLGPYIVAALIALLAFWLAGWLLDRKVEV